MSYATTGWIHGYTVTVQGSPDRVFAALPDQAQLTKWFAESAPQ